MPCEKLNFCIGLDSLGVYATIDEHPLIRTANEVARLMLFTKRALRLSGLDDVGFGMAMAEK